MFCFVSASVARGGTMDYFNFPLRIGLIITTKFQIGIPRITLKNKKHLIKVLLSTVHTKKCYTLSFHQKISKLSLLAAETVQVTRKLDDTYVLGAVARKKKI